MENVKISQYKILILLSTPWSKFSFPHLSDMPGHLTIVLP